MKNQQIATGQSEHSENAPALSLPAKFFQAKINRQAIFDSVMSERASLRQGTHKVKTKAEVSGSGKKPFSQKGTGNARQGSKRSPQWVGGGVVSGPNDNKNYKLKVNKKVKRIAFKSALTLKSNDQAVLVHDFEPGQKPHTKHFLKQFSALKINSKFKKILVVTDNQIIFKSVANLPKISTIKLPSLTIRLILNFDFIIFSSAAIETLRNDQ